MALRATREQIPQGEPVELTQDEVRSIFESKVERSLGMSGTEFLERLDAGTLPDNPAVEEITVLVGGDAR